MRLSGILLAASAFLALSGCSSTSSVDSLQLTGPSSETTSSVVRPIPAAEIGSLDQTVRQEAQPDFAPEQAALPQAEVPQPFAEVPPAPASLARQAALVAPAKPTSANEAVAATQIFSRRFRDAKPINFGKTSPRSLAVHGVDVSRWQGDIDWVKLRSQGANFAYIKATDGGDHTDPMFRKNWRAADKAGLKRGAYHFFYWCRTASDQADWFIRNVPREAGALPPVIDVEWNGESRCKRRPSRETVLEKMQVFMDRLERHYGQRPIIYTAPDFYRDNLKGAFPNHHFWLRAVAQHPSKVYPGRKWLFWQYSGSGLSHGVSGRIDLNVFRGSDDEWREWIGQAS